MSISILELSTNTAKDVIILSNILLTVGIHSIMTTTFNKTICVVCVVEAILTQMYLVYSVQIQTMGLGTLLIIHVKIIQVGMQIGVE